MNVIRNNTNIMECAALVDPIILGYAINENNRLEITLPTTLCTVSQNKNIIQTEIEGRDGTIKEYIGQDDYNIEINGVLTAVYNGQSPLTDVVLLKRILDIKEPIDVTNGYLNRFGIFHLVIKDYTFNQEAGGYSKQDFSITAVSDVTFITMLSGG